jgi:hypothetical protein
LLTSNLVPQITSAVSLNHSSLRRPLEFQYFREEVKIRVYIGPSFFCGESDSKGTYLLGNANNLSN